MIFEKNRRKLLLQSAKKYLNMNIAIIGTGNVGGALATKWAHKGHHLFLGVNDTAQFKGKDLLQNPNTSVHSIAEAVQQADVILLATPAPAAVAVAQSLGDTSGKIIIDAMNIVMGRGPQGFANTADAILANTATREVVKCFNTTGFNNMQNTMYGDTAIDMFVAGDSAAGKAAAIQLAKDAGFAECYNVGGNDKFTLMEQFAFFWINLAMMQGQGRDIAFKLLKR
jgi:predicted dinucleotide-binding enzyme